MSRNLPPSPRRLQAFRASGQQLNSPLLVWCGAAAAVALFALSSWDAMERIMIARLNIAINATSTSTAVLVSDVLHDFLQRLLMLTGSAAGVALFVHLLVARTLWSPRRNVAMAPTMPRGSSARILGLLGSSIAAVSIFLVAIAWLWLAAPFIASLLQPNTLPARRWWVAGCTALLSTLLIAALVIAAAALAWRWWRIKQALQMTAAEYQQDQREASVPAPMRQHLAQQMRAATNEYAADLGTDAHSAECILLYSQGYAALLQWDPQSSVSSTPVVRSTHIGTDAHRMNRRWHQAGGQRIWVGPLAKQLAINALGPLPSQYWPAVASALVAMQKSPAQPTGSV
jgi:flagellar biosynthesis protein FlhB